MATVRIPSLMRDLTGGKEAVSMPGRTVGEVIDALDEVYPGVCLSNRSGPELN